MNYYKLSYLRKHTLLNPFELIKISRMRYEAEEAQMLINRLEHCQLGVDFNKADEYEYNVRFKVWMNDLMSLWSKYSSGTGLYEFADSVLDQNIEREKKELNNAIIRKRIE